MSAIDLYSEETRERIATVAWPGDFSAIPYLLADLHRLRDGRNLFENPLVFAFYQRYRLVSSSCLWNFPLEDRFEPVHQKQASEAQPQSVSVVPKLRAILDLQSITEFFYVFLEQERLLLAGTSVMMSCTWYLLRRLLQ